MSLVYQAKRCFKILSGFLLAAAASAAEHNAYLQLNAGAVFTPSFVQTSKFTGCIATPVGFDCDEINQTSKETYDTGFAGSFALGYRLADQFRIEGEVLYQSNDRDKFQYTATSANPAFNFSFSDDLVGERERFAFLLNGYFDFKNSTAFTPYLTAGLGGYHLRMKLDNRSIENELDFAWQAGAGVNYRLNDRIGFDLKYRYLGGADAELQLEPPSNLLPARSRSLLYEVGDHQILAGLRVSF